MNYPYLVKLLESVYHALPIKSIKIAIFTDNYYIRYTTLALARLIRLDGLVPRHTRDMVQAVTGELVRRTARTGSSPENNVHIPQMRVTWDYHTLGIDQILLANHQHQLHSRIHGKEP